MNPKKADSDADEIVRINNVFSNYNAVVGAAMAAFASGKRVQAGYSACINNYAYKITDFSICGATCPP